MGEPTLFPNASTKDTLAYCWRQMRPDRAAFTGACTGHRARHAGQCRRGAADLRCRCSGRIANLGVARAGLWQSFAPLIVAYALVLVAATVFGRIGGWLNWGATLRSFGRAITNGYDHLIGLSHALAHRPPVG